MKPEPRYGHAISQAIVQEPKQITASVNFVKKACSVWLFGGRDENKYYNDIWELHFPNFEGLFRDFRNILSNTLLKLIFRAKETSGIWEKLKDCQGEIPSERYGHSICIYGKYIILFGGKSASGLLSDLFLFHTGWFFIVSFFCFVEMFEVKFCCFLAPYDLQSLRCGLNQILLENHQAVDITILQLSLVTKCVS